MTRVKDFDTTATTGTNDDYFGIDGATSGTRKILVSKFLEIAATTLASAGFFLDEDDMSSDSATKVASQQSIKAYVDANAGGGDTGAKVLHVAGPATSQARISTIAGQSTPAEVITVYKFTASGTEYLDFHCHLSSTYGGGGLTVHVPWLSEAATSGVCVWEGAIRRIQDDAEDLNTTAHTYQYNTVNATAASAAGELDYATITFTDGADMDSLAAGEDFIFRMRRQGGAGSDTLSGDACLRPINIEETSA